MLQPYRGERTRITVTRQRRAPCVAQLSPVCEIRSGHGDGGGGLSEIEFLNVHGLSMERATPSVEARWALRRHMWGRSRDRQR
ncbi:hypothetical protein NDU88_012134 [Pleurodeles waltl]|uniref:Uncharacterized protein n=1 Tax=Pleurodeles waltl TaxID=8319 RepID=A0AAV7QZ98_PLEWA|nr:hypothetical protein NDU88_012134 [Pleurodeles waltl]